MRRARGSPGCAQHVRHWSSMLGNSYSEVTASAPRLPVRLDHECAAKTWATAPPLKTVVLIGSMVSGARKIRSPAPRTAGWMRRRYSSIRPVSTSDRANRAPPWASRYPSERSCLSRVGFGQVSGGDRRLAPIGGRERVREHDLGDLVHRLGERPGGAGPVGGHHRVGGGTHEVRPALLTVSTVQRGRHRSLPGRSSRCSRQLVRRSRRADGHLGPVRPWRCFLPGMDDTSCSSRW